MTKAPIIQIKDVIILLILIFLNIEINATSE